MAKTVLLIDGDQYLYRACAACESETKWDDENHVLSSNELEAWDTVHGSLKKLFYQFSTKDHVLTFSDGENFRKTIDPSYKSNRAGTRKPLCFAAVKERLRTEYNSLSFTGLEADDVMGILATKPGPSERIIIAADKDMKTIPGKLWNGTGLQVISAEEADYWHLYQALIGDSSDGYKGCPGIGPKKAEALLAPFVFKSGEGTSDCHMGAGCTGCLRCATSAIAWPVVVEAYLKAGLTEADALVQARLARILRWSDWDSESKKPKLWSPT